MSDSTNQFLLQMSWKLWQSASFLITCMKRYQFAIMINQESLYVRGFSKISEIFLSETYARAQHDTFLFYSIFYGADIKCAQH